MIIYHGSNVVVEQPRIFASERMLDFGLGFYSTTNKDQASRWAERVSARRGSSSRFITEYEFDYDNASNLLTIISFDEPDENWLEFICQNRSGRISANPYDIVIGPVANDQVYATVTLYEQGLLSKAAAISELKVRKLFDQILFHTEKSLDYCHYLRHTEIGV
jgi:hypothetical protein